MPKSIAAIILSAGFSSRMSGHHKALLPLGSSATMLEYLIKNYKQAGIKQIYVVLGHEEKEIAKAIEHLNCNLVYNEDFEKGMFSSLAKGISALDNKIQACFINPVDAPLIKSSSIANILEKRNNNQLDKIKSIIIPSFLNKCGHPPLIDKEHFKPIIKAYKAGNSGGLRAYFANFLTDDAKNEFLLGNRPINYDDGKIDFLNISDAGVLCDLDTFAEYNQAKDFLLQTNNRKSPDISECFHLLLVADLPERTKKHCLKIAFGALRIGLALKEKLNCDLSLLNCICGGLLHDICRTQKKHGLVGAKYLRSLGYDMLGSIVGTHTNLPSSVLEKIGIFIDEEKLYTEEVGDLVDNIDYLYPAIAVYLADKFYSSDEHISLATRHKLIREKHHSNDNALEAITTRENVAVAVKKYFDKLTGLDAEICVDTPTNNSLEQTLMELLRKYKI